jgi:hypothetical protein
MQGFDVYGFASKSSGSIIPQLQELQMSVFAQKDNLLSRGRVRADFFHDITKQSQVLKEQGVAALTPDRQLFIDPNVITDIGREQFLKVICDLSSDHVTKMAIGDGGAPISDPFVPDPPSITDTTLVNNLASQEISDITVQNGGSPAQYFIEYIELFIAADYFTTGLPFLDTSQKVVNEAGLVTSSAELLCARKTFASIPFDPGTNIAVRFTWDIFIN